MQYDILLDDFLDILSNLGVNVSKLSIEEEAKKYPQFRWVSLEDLK